MSNNRQQVALGELLKKSEESIPILPDQEYEEVTVRLWGKGVVSRGVTLGSRISAERRIVVRPKQFIMSKIDARNGALGLVPANLDGAVVSNDFPVFDIDRSRLLPAYLGWLVRTQAFVELCKRASEGTTNRVRIKEDRFLAKTIPLPPLGEQERIVAIIETVADRVAQINESRTRIECAMHSVTTGAFSQAVAGAAFRRMEDVAPITRRPIEITPEGEYPELGIRSFGRGTFHKPAVSGSAVGSKRLYRIAPGDLIFSNVFAWEGAVAVVKPQDEGRCGSHRFITCIPKEGIARSPFLWFYFLSAEGLEKLGKASPGGAGRNRTLGLEALSNITVPVPEHEKQLWFEEILEKANGVREIQQRAAENVEVVLMPAVLSKAFAKEL